MRDATRQTLRSFAFLIALAWAASGAGVHRPLASAAERDSVACSERVEDLRLLRAEYVEKSPAFSDAARARAGRLIEATEQDAGQLTEAQFALRLAGVAAFADNAHDSLMLGRWRPRTRLPVRLVWFSDGLAVTRAAPEAADLVGATVLAVGGLSTEQVFSRLRPYQGGSEAYRRWSLGWLLQSPEMLEALGITSAERPRLTFRLADGRILTRVLTPTPAADMPKVAFPAGVSSFELSADEQRRGWRALHDGAGEPLYLSHPEQWFRTEDLDDGSVLYVQFRSNMDMGEARIAPFVAALGERMRAAPPTHLILDLRFDTGGDNTQNRELMKIFAQKVPGRIYVLTGPFTFSAGIATAAALVHDTGGRAIIVGEEVGDRTRWWSEYEPVCLPHSGACFNRNRGLWDIVRGCAREARCFGDRFDINVRDLKPTIRAPLTVTAWRSGRDPGLEAITADLAKAQARAGSSGGRPRSSASR